MIDHICINFNIYYQFKLTLNHSYVLELSRNNTSFNTELKCFTVFNLQSHPVRHIF